MAIDLAHTTARPVPYLDTVAVIGDAMPESSVQFGATLDVLLHDLEHSGDEHAFSASALTKTGSPFEVAFASADPRLRYTVEPSPQSVAHRDRLAHNCEVLERLGAGPLPHHILRRFAHAQHQEATFGYGAQIGARHAGETVAYKLYGELPVEAKAMANDWAEQALGVRPILGGDGRGAYPTLAGLDLGGDDVEFYYRVENLHPLEIDTILGQANMADRGGEVRALLSEPLMLPIRHHLPGPTWGYSYQRDRSGQLAVTLYTFAHTFFGPDAATRAALLSMAERHDWDLTTYERLSAPLENARHQRLHHGIFGVVVRHGQPLSIWIGLAPVGH